MHCDAIVLAVASARFVVAPVAVVVCAVAKGFKVSFARFERRVASFHSHAGATPMPPLGPALSDRCSGEGPIRRQEIALRRPPRGEVNDCFPHIRHSDACWCLAERSGLLPDHVRLSLFGNQELKQRQAPCPARHVTVAAARLAGAADVRAIFIDGTRGRCSDFADKRRATRAVAAHPPSITGNILSRNLVEVNIGLRRKPWPCR